MSKLWGIVISNKYVYVGQKVNDVFGPNPTQDVGPGGWLTVAAGSKPGSAGLLLHPSPVGALVAGVADAQLLVGGTGVDLADVVLKLDDVEQNWNIFFSYSCIVWLLKVSIKYQTNSTIQS